MRPDRRFWKVTLGFLGVAVIGFGAVGLVRPSASAPRPAAASPGGAASAVPISGRRLAAPLLGEPLVGGVADLRLGRGRVVLVNFWASWCDPCRREAPELARYAAEPAHARLVGVAVNDGRASALGFIRTAGWRYPNLLDADGGLMAPYGILGLPSTIVVDGEGRIAARLLGPQTVGSLERAAAEVASAGA